MPRLSRGKKGLLIVAVAAMISWIGYDFVQYIKDLYEPNMFRSRLESYAETLKEHHRSNGHFPSEASELFAELGLFNDRRGGRSTIAFSSKDAFAIHYEARFHSRLFLVGADPKVTIAWQAGSPVLMIESALPRP